MVVRGTGHVDKELGPRHHERESRVVHTMVFQPLNENFISIALQCASDITASGAS
jgi:hypothetical protein